MVVGRLVSFWEGLFSGAMLNFGRVWEGKGFGRREPFLGRLDGSGISIELMTRIYSFTFFFDGWKSEDNAFPPKRNLVSVGGLNDFLVVFLWVGKQQGTAITQFSQESLLSFKDKPHI